MLIRLSLLLSLTLLVNQPAESAPGARTSAGALLPFGLQGKRITALRMARDLGPASKIFYAIADSDGVFRREFGSADTSWQSLGLVGKKLVALDIQVWGIGPMDFHAPVVGVSPDFSNSDTSLIYRLEGNNWVPVDSGIVRSQGSSITALASFESSGHAPPGEAFAGADGLIYRSATFAQRWQPIENGPTGVINVISMGREFAGNDVWTGGETNIFWPWIARSIDAGRTWEIFYPDLSGDNACNSLAIHPEYPEVVYAGMEGAVIKTIDGGKSWNYTGLRDTPVYFYALVLDPFDSDHVFAGGLITDPNNWALWESFDEGVTWQAIPPPAAVKSAAGITDVVADQTTPGIVYLATLGDGVWRYEGKVTSVDDRGDNTPRGFVLKQNYPNPFRSEGLTQELAGQSANTTIRFTLASPSDGERVHLAIYNLRGELVRELVDQSLPTGEHAVRWDGRDVRGRPVAAGVYLYRLQAGKVAEVRKLTLIN